MRSDGEQVPSTLVGFLWQVRRLSPGRVQQVKGLADPLGQQAGGRPQLLKTSSWLTWGGSTGGEAPIPSAEVRGDKQMVVFLLWATAPPWPPCQPQPRGSGGACCWQSVCLSVCHSLWLRCCSAAVLWGQRELLVTGRSALFGVPAARTEPVPVILAGCEGRGCWRLSKGISCRKSEQNGGK